MFERSTPQSFEKNRYALSATTGHQDWKGRPIEPTGKLVVDVLARPENVALVRQNVTDHAETLGLSQGVIADLKTVISEACANVVLHAYAEANEPGSLQVELTPAGRALEIVVRDEGTGIHPVAGAGTPASLRLGLLLIGALSCSFQLSSIRGRGTELKIKLPLGIA